MLNHLYPDIWTPNRQFKIGYRSLAHHNDRKTPPRTIPNKIGLVWCTLFGTSTQVNLVRRSQGWSRIVVGLMRASNKPPNYGGGGMVERAAAAATLWVEREPESRALIVANARTHASSNHHLFIKDAFFAEIFGLFNAASRRPSPPTGSPPPAPLLVEMVLLGNDGLTTNMPGLVQLYDTYPALDIQLVIVVANDFPNREFFGQHLAAGSGCARFGKFALRDLVYAFQHPDSEGHEAEQFVLGLWEMILGGKKGCGGLEYGVWTHGRSNFDLSPGVKNGIDPARPVKTRALH